MKARQIIPRKDCPFIFRANPHCSHIWRCRGEVAEWANRSRLKFGGKTQLNFNGMDYWEIISKEEALKRLPLMTETSILLDN